MEQLSFLSEDQVRRVQQEFGTPVYVYDERTLEEQAKKVLAFPNPYGLTARYAMKALPNAAVIRIFNALGLHIDASSGFEVERALHAGVPASHIQITAQEIPKNLPELLDKGVLFNACSIHQLREYGKLRPKTDICVRINPGLGSGHSNRTNVGGPSASFGIWHEQTDEILSVQREYGLRVSRMHTHVGSGTDPEVWNCCAQLSLAIAARLEEVQSLSLGGGFKVARMSYETSADLQVIGKRIYDSFEAFYNTHHRKLHMEIEPGTFLAAPAGALVCPVIDLVNTGTGGYQFIKVDSGMTENARPGMYGAQHPVVVVPVKAEQRGIGEYLVVGHCCESGDILTPEPANPEGIKPRELTEAKIGDAVVVCGAGAYCAGMSCKNYNSFPEAPEVLLQKDGAFKLIRRRQTIDQVIENEV